MFVALLSWENHASLIMMKTLNLICIAPFMQELHQKKELDNKETRKKQENSPVLSFVTMHFPADPGGFLIVY